ATSPIGSFPPSTTAWPTPPAGRACPRLPAWPPPGPSSPCPPVDPPWPVPYLWAPFSARQGSSMLPWVKLDEANVPGGDVLRLMQRGTEFSIMSGTTELMNSRLSGSEEQLAILSAARLAGRPPPRVLIGGLGMGFTLRAALAAFPAQSELIVAELVPQVI